ncbi:MAG TPA: DUF1501 domain-containing protein [Bryobacteraceae bacterium]|nr:DUF1501 domain-containing protein [Bryobacteraceae bacterium]
MLTRRILMKNGALTVVGMGAVPHFLHRTALAAGTAQGKKKVLVAIFLRGGADGLNIVVPYGDKDYAPSRPSIGIPAPVKDKPSALDLDGFFGLHPLLQPLLPIYKKGHLGVVHATGSPDASRSHFEAQDFMESAAPGNKSVTDGWLNRYLSSNPDPKATPFRAISINSTLPRALTGRATALAINDLADVERASAFEAAFGSLYHQESDTMISGTARDMFGAIRALKALNLEKGAPGGPGGYARFGEFGTALRQIAQLIKANVGLEIAYLDIPAWDTHNNQGGLEGGGSLSQPLRQLGGNLASFYRDLGDRMEDVVVLTMSEFGRTVRENGSSGTDHGHGNAMFVIGGAVQGGKVHGQWPGLAREQLYEGRDLAVTTDFRDVFAELLAGHMGCSNADKVFPGYALDPKRFRGLLRTPAVLSAA